MTNLNTTAALETYADRSGAARAARKALGADRISGVHFRVAPSAGGRFAWEALATEDAAPTTSTLVLTSDETVTVDLEADAPVVTTEPTPEPTPAPVKAKGKAKAKTPAKAKAPKKEKAPAKPLFTSVETQDGVEVKTSAKFPKAPGKVLKFSARWKTAGGNDNLGPWVDTPAKAVEQAKVHLADGRKAWVICGWR